MSFSCQSHRVPTIVREVSAEFLGTFIMMSFGIGSVAQFVLSGGTTGSSDQIRWSWGLGVTFGVFTAGGISGGHLNPAVTLALCVVKKFPWRKMLPYWLAQYLGSFLAACVVYIVYHDAVGTEKTMKTAAIFSTYPKPFLSIWNGMADQIFATAILLFLIMALTDQENDMAPGKGYLPIAVGLVVTVIGMTFGFNCGYAINPARDFSPRLFTCMAGWGNEVFSFDHYYWIFIPVIGPYAGAVLGSLVYVIFIKMKNPFQSAEDTPETYSDPEVNNSTSLTVNSNDANHQCVAGTTPM